MNNITNEDMQRLNHVVTSIVEYVTVKGFKAVVDPLTEIDVYRRLRIFKMHEGRQIYVDAKISAINETISIPRSKDNDWSSWKAASDRCMQQVDEMVSRARVAGYGATIPVSLELIEPFVECESNPRDTQFAGSAQLVIDKVVGNGFVLYNNDLKKILAQYAYNLVKHAIENTQPINLDRLDIDEIVQRIPDMTEWPEEEG